MRNSRAVGLGIALWLAACCLLMAQNQPPVAAGLSAEEVAARLEARNRQQAQALQGFEGVRVYRLQYHGLGGNRDAEMTVRMTFQAPDKKDFTVVEQEGSKLFIDRVLKKLVQSEQDAMEEDNRRRSALTMENYDFAVVDHERWSGRSCYVLQVRPRHSNRFLYQGKIWVDAREFAVVHIEAEPARNPSLWIKKTNIEHDYVKVGDFWFPARNRTESQIRLGGHASLTIDYTNYRIVAALPAEERETAKRFGFTGGCRASGSSLDTGACVEAPNDLLSNTK